MDVSFRKLLESPMEVLLKHGYTDQAIDQHELTNGLLWTEEITIYLILRPGSDQGYRKVSSLGPIFLLPKQSADPRTQKSKSKTFVELHTQVLLIDFYLEHILNS